MTILPHNPNAFTRSPLDRASHHRTDAAWLEAALVSEQTRVAVFHERRPFLVEEGDALTVRWLGGHTPHELGIKDGATLFLGVDTNDIAHFAFEIADASRLEGLGQFTDLRAALPRLDAQTPPILGAAKSVFEWHARNRFCANCGGPSEIAEAGWKRQCPRCSGEHFPRVDPVCIMLPVFGDKCLLGRQRPWPRGMHSALAGFIEPGEAIEEAVARETLEEAGLKVRHVRMHSTQPWPFAHSLMIGAICEVEDDRETIDQKELESGRWFTRDEIRHVIKGEYPGGIFCPPTYAIAGQLIRTWADEG